MNTHTKVGVLTKEITLPKVSVVVATYRRSESLRNALESIIAQTYTNIEVIVIDDNADVVWNERVHRIITDFIDELNSKIILIKNQSNKGSAESRNVGIYASTGEYITFLDDDDLYLPLKIENQLSDMIDKNSDYSITDISLFSEKDRLIEKRTRKYIKYITKESLLKYHLMYHLTGTDAMMFKREYLMKIKGFASVDVGDEFYLMLNAIEAGGKFSYLSISDIKAYVHSETSGLSSGKGKIDGENILYEFKKKYFSGLTKKEIKYINMRHYAVIAFAELRRSNFKQFILNSIISFACSPYQCLKLFFSRFS